MDAESSNKLNEETKEDGTTTIETSGTLPIQQESEVDAESSNKLNVASKEELMASDEITVRVTDLKDSIFDTVDNSHAPDNWRSIFGDFGGLLKQSMVSVYEYIYNTLYTQSP